MTDNAKIPDNVIYECLTSFHVPCRLSDIKNPTPDFMISVFENFLKDLSINHTNKSFHLTEHIEHPEIYEDSVTLINMIFILNSVLSSSGLNITAADIMAPKPKRTRNILRGLIIFWKFYYSKLNHFQSVSNSLQSVRDEAMEMSKRIEEMELKKALNLEFIKAQEDKGHPERVQENIKLIKRLKEERLALDEKYKILKEKSLAVDSKTDSMDKEMIVMKQQIAELDECILHSPDKRKLATTVQDLKGEIKAVDQSIREENKKLSDLAKRIEDCGVNQEELVKDAAYLEDTLALLDQLRDIAKSHLSDKLMYEKELKLMSQLKNEVQTKEDLKSLFAEKEAKNKLLLKKQNSLLIENLRKLKSEVRDAEACNSSLKSKNSEMDTQIVKLVEDLNEIKDCCTKTQEMTAQRKKEVYSEVESLLCLSHTLGNKIKDMLLQKFSNMKPHDK